MHIVALLTFLTSISPGNGWRMAPPIGVHWSWFADIPDRLKLVQAILFPLLLFPWSLLGNLKLTSQSPNSTELAYFCYTTLFDVLFRQEVSLGWRWECGQEVMSLSSGMFHVVTQLSALYLESIWCDWHGLE